MLLFYSVSVLGIVIDSYTINVHREKYSLVLEFILLLFFFN